MADGDNLRDAQREYMRRVRRPVGFITVDLAYLRKQFTRIVGPPGRVFGCGEAATVAGANYGAFFKWLKLGIVRASVRPRRGCGQANALGFSWFDAFVGAVAGALFRAGCDAATVKQAADLLYRREPKSEATSTTGSGVPAVAT